MTSEERRRTLHAAYRDIDSVLRGTAHLAPADRIAHVERRLAVALRVTARRDAVRD
jgi:hypothetical protein